LEPRVSALADDAADDLLVAAVLAFVRGKHLDAPAVRLRVAAVHPEQVACEESRLVAARARADLEEQVRVVVRILRHEVQSELALLRVALLAQRGGLLLAERPQLLVVAAGKLLGRGEILLELPIRGEIAGDRL